MVPDTSVAATRNCWDPMSAEAKPFPWPPTESNPWVQMRSVFFKDHLVDWPLTGKEKSQLLDLWEDWGSLVVDQVWEMEQPVFSTTEIHGGVCFVCLLVPKREILYCEP